MLLEQRSLLKWPAKLIITLLVLLTTIESLAQYDPFTIPLVYQVPEMQKIKVDKAKVYKIINKDSALTFDAYYPANFDRKKNLPLVVFVNGVGSLELPEWKIYQDWGRLVASNGMIAICHQSRFRESLRDVRDLIEYIRQHSDELKINKDNIALWMCSGNTPAGWAIANDPKNNFIKAAAILYGFTNPKDRFVKRKDLEILLIRAGLDSYNLNSGLEEFAANALQTDAHMELINYPEGQHAFDGFDNNTRSKEIIIQTIDFFKRNLVGDNTEAGSPFISNRQFWNLVVNENKTDSAIQLYKVAFDAFSKYPSHTSFFNQILNENNLNALGYQLLEANRIEDALKSFSLNAELFPASPNSFDALSDAYEKKGDRDNTIRNAKLALDKLKTAANINPAFANAIRESATAKINKIENPEPDSVPHRRAHHELLYDESNKSVMMVSGSTPLNGGQSFRFFNDIWRFTESGWVKSGIAGDERSGIRLAYDTRRNKIFSFGGFSGNSSKSELRILTDNKWKILSDDPEMQAAEPGFVYDSFHDKLITFGGSAAMGKVNATTWLWDGYVWQKLNGNGPDGRQAFVMVYDSKRNRTVLFGGMGSSDQLYGDTWEFDGTQWTKVSDTGPGARMSSGFAYDSKRGMVVIFGGIANGVVKGDMWGWNGKMWKKLAETGPAPRMMGYLAYDKNRDKIVLFGGRVRWPEDKNDTWEWDGKEWREIK